MAVIAITSLESPATVEDNGGEILTMIGTFPTGDILVFIDDGVVEHPCYSGVPGQGYTCQRLDATTLKAVAPPVAAGDHDIIVRSDPDEDTLVAGLSVANRFWRSMAFLLRRSFPPIFAVGPRDISLQDDLT